MNKSLADYVAELFGSAVWAVIVIVLVMGYVGMRGCSINVDGHEHTFKAYLGQDHGVTR